MVIAAVGQIRSTSNIAHNLIQCQALVSKAVAAGAKVLFLPEASDYIAYDSSESQALARSPLAATFVQGLSAAAKEHNISINVGVHEPAHGGKVANSLLWINEQGKIMKRYQKIHLFDVDIPGKVLLRESAGVEPGKEIVKPFDTPIGKLGLAICYDLRFPEISLSLRRQGAEILTFPSAFTIHTGRKHWLPLLTARAIETQSWVIAAAQIGNHNDKRASWGQSLIINPDGRVVVELKKFDVEDVENELDVCQEVGVADIDLKLLEQTRQGMPLWNQRRTDVYPEI